MPVTTDSLESFLLKLRTQSFPHESFLGFLHVIVGGGLVSPEGHRLVSGISWRDLALLLKKVRWDPAMVRQLGVDPTKLAPRDRERFWYQAICQAGLDSPVAKKSAQRLKGWLDRFGYSVSV